MISLYGASEMKIGLLTTSNVNIGDDFIRTGIQHLLGQLTQEELSYVIVNKHRPLSAIYPSVFSSSGPSGPISHRLARLAGLLTGRYAKTIFDSCDLLIQCGTPIMWHGCSKSEWADIIWRGVFQRRSVPLINLAGGSCYAWAEREDVKLAAKDREFIEHMGKIADLTTVRDPLGQSLFAKLGLTANLLPCTAFLAAMACENPLQGDNKNGVVDVVFNFMPGGGHFDFDGLHLQSAWEKCFMEVYRIIKSKGYRTGFICHSTLEMEKAMLIDPSVPVWFPKSPQEYFALLKGVRGAFVNRLHAAVGLGGAAIPCVSVGSDTRMLMVREFGIPCHWVGELPEPDDLVEQLENMMNSNESGRLMDLRMVLEKTYLSLMAPYVR